ncbi:MAG TPA: class I adenylate-forming enzyme family protein [Acidimicrobiales bacterium]|jgi:acyl-CoA synthetase (AMP-forming)/AMP-acid ligase II|nr:class I adenylate-forming enzyme family protein [Acidimicrobiales bacterium]
MAKGIMHRGLERAAVTGPDVPAVLAGDDWWTFADLHRASNAAAAHLASCGVQPGSRVAVMTSNRPEFIVTVNAVSKLGAASVLLNPAWKALEVENALRLTAPVAAVADGEGAALLSSRLDGTVLNLDDESVRSSPALDRHSDLAAPRVRVDDEDDAVLVFSSGTTDRPKAVRHTHASISLATEHWCLALGLGPTDRFQVATPPSHILGLLNLLAAAEAGATVRLHRRFDLNEELRYIQQERMTLEMAVAPIALAMANHPDLESFDLSSLRYIMWGATPVTASVADTVTARTGVRWLPAYGTSEVPVITSNPVSRPDEWRLDSAGCPVGDVSLRAVDLDSGEVVASGTNGEIQVRSASAMAGYLPDSETSAAFVDGWYRTGDVGWLDEDGWVHLTDRCKEMIKVNGFQVAPAEIESVLHGHPSVIDCAVFGVPDERAGEVPVAAIQLEPAAAVDGAELQQLVADTLATYKQLRAVVLVDAVPRTPSGKVLRRTLRDEWLSGALSASSAGAD